MTTHIGDVFVGQELAFIIYDISANGYDIVIYVFDQQKRNRYHDAITLVPDTSFTGFRLATKTETAKYTLLAGW